MSKEMNFFSGKETYYVKGYTYLVIVQTTVAVKQIKLILEKEITTMEDVNDLNKNIEQLYGKHVSLLSFHYLRDEKNQIKKEKEKLPDILNAGKTDPTNVLV